MFDPFDGKTKRPTLGCDSVILTKKVAKEGGSEEWFVLLIERGHDPFMGKWALPGGFLEWSESCEQGAARELEEETSLKNVDLKLLGVFSKPGRDPRGSIVSISYIGFVDTLDADKAVGGDDAAKAEWFALNQAPELAFDHSEVLEAARNFLKTNKK